MREINEKEKDPEKPLAKHFASCHGGSIIGMKVNRIYVLKLPTRRGDFECLLLKKKKGGYIG